MLYNLICLNYTAFRDPKSIFCFLAVFFKITLFLPAYHLKVCYQVFNAHLESKELEKYCILDKEGEELLKMAILELGISVRAYDKILKVARTIADLEEKETIEASHISEAISYRSLDRDFWII